MRHKLYVRSLLISYLFVLTVSIAFGQVDITTWQGNLQHWGLNSSETTLSRDTVTPGNFGQLFTQQLDGENYGQPLFVSSATLNNLPGTFKDGQPHNVVYVATEAGTMFAFDADKDLTGQTNTQGTNSAPLWKQSLIPAGAQPLPAADSDSGDITPFFGGH